MYVCTVEDIPNWQTDQQKIILLFNIKFIFNVGSLKIREVFFIFPRAIGISSSDDDCRY